jgi:alkanesulfonate monooxygenase
MILESRGLEQRGLELRGGVRAAPVLGDTPAEREALRFAPDPRARDADPGYIVATARRDERDGIDSALVTQSSSWPDPLTVAAWALQPTTRLRVVAAHRIGTVAPTVAARTLATLHRLSGGRAGVHLILGSSDDDVHRDGDTLDKEQRYRRVGEFLEIFTRTLTATEPFDFQGEFYDVRDAWSGVRLEGGPGPEISFAGSSDRGIALAARYADVYGLALHPPGPTLAMIDRVRAAARAEGRADGRADGRTDGHDGGRRLRIWRNATFVLAETEDEARAKARRIAESVVALHAKAGITAEDVEWIRRYPRANDTGAADSTTGDSTTAGTGIPGRTPGRRWRGTRGACLSCRSWARPRARPPRCSPFIAPALTSSSSPPPWRPRPTGGCAAS